MHFWQMFYTSNLNFYMCFSFSLIELVLLVFDGKNNVMIMWVNASTDDVMVCRYFHLNLVIIHYAKDLFCYIQGSHNSLIIFTFRWAIHYKNLNSPD